MRALEQAYDQFGKAPSLVGSCLKAPRYRHSGGKLQNLQAQLVSAALATAAAAALLGSAAEVQAQSAATGRYIGTVQAEWNLDGRRMSLLAPFEYVDAKNERWVVPKGAVIDGASIPRFAWSFIGGPFEGRYRDASVIHDSACNEKKRPWNLVHENFYWAMLTSGVEATKAKIMYAAVYHFGPRWVTPSAIPGGAIDVPPENKLSEADFQVLKMQIESRDQSDTAISLREIRSFGR